jgi:2,4-dienoyl-CoA reductase-like NADH-dependent reductase (Old Yellow Enzyme family)/nucleotide-binding universal stress UspA family protein
LNLIRGFETASGRGEIMGPAEKEKTLKFATLFSPFRLGPYWLKNRLVALPVYTGYAYPDGRVSPQLIEHYTKLARSGVAMVVVANAAVASDGVTSTYSLRVDRDEYIPGLARLAKVIKQHGAIACLQLNHAGRFAKTDRPIGPFPADSSNLAFNIGALKDFMNFFPLEKRFGLTRYFLKQANKWRNAITAENVERIIVNFGEAAARAHAAGFDVIELHGANGYLLCEFLSPFTNRILDEFGGSFQNRTAFPLTVIREIRRKLNADVPVGFRLMLREYVPGGIDLPEAVAFARLLEKEGIIYLSGSVGSFNSIFFKNVRKKMAQPGYLRKDMSKLSRKVSIATIISGRVTKPVLANELLQENTADLIGLGRPLRVDFNWVKKARTPDQKIILCKNCNWCLKRVVLEQGFSCSRWPRPIQQRTDLNHLLLNRNYKGLWVVVDRNDLKLLKNALPIFLPEGQRHPVPISPTIFFLKTHNDQEISNEDRKTFLEWSRKTLDRCGFDGGLINHVAKSAKEACDKELHAEIMRRNYGVVIIGRNPHHPWRERLLYQERGKVIALLGPGERSNHILVPIDLSESTLLVLAFLRQLYIGRAAFNLDFIHVLTGPEKSVQHRWKELKRIIELDENLELHCIPKDREISDIILERVKAGTYGTIVMGKRGHSGIKRWLLGSVSRGVLRGLTEQSLFLVD